MLRVSITFGINFIGTFFKRALLDGFIKFVMFWLTVISIGILIFFSQGLIREGVPAGVKFSCLKRLALQIRLSSGSSIDRFQKIVVFFLFLDKLGEKVKHVVLVAGVGLQNNLWEVEFGTRSHYGKF